MPQIGHLPGLSSLTCGCVGHEYTSATGALSPGAAWVWCSCVMGSEGGEGLVGGLAGSWSSVDGDGSSADGAFGSAGSPAESRGAGVVAAQPDSQNPMR